MKQILIILTILSSIPSSAKDFSLIPYRVGEKWGFCNQNKKVVIKPQYERSYWFADNGLARVKTKGKFGYIDKDGNIKIEAKFSDASDFSYGGALVSFEDKNYCLDETGHLEETNATKAFGCSGLESTDGDGICSNCCVPFQSNGLTGIVCKEFDFVDGEFKLIASDSISAQYDTIYSSIGYSPEFMPLIASKNKKFGIVNSKNKIIYEFRFDSIEVISFNTYLLKDGNNWSLNDSAKALFNNISSVKSYIFYSGYYFPVKVNGKWGVINAKGEQVIPFQFEDILLPSRHIIQREFTIKMNGKWGYISDKGNINPIYDSLDPFNGYEYTLVTKNGMEGYIDRDGKEYFKE